VTDLVHVPGSEKPEPHVVQPQLGEVLIAWRFGRPGRDVEVRKTSEIRNCVAGSGDRDPVRRAVRAADTAEMPWLARGLEETRIV
jgi:hypothetical protein